MSDAELGSIGDMVPASAGIRGFDRKKLPPVGADFQAAERGRRASTRRCR